MASGQLSRAEALACSGCRHACHMMLYSDTKTQLFGRIPIKHIILVSQACVYVFLVVVCECKWLSSYMHMSWAHTQYNSLCHFPQMQMRFDGLLGFPGGWVFPGAAFVLCFYVHRYVLLRFVTLSFSTQTSPINKDINLYDTIKLEDNKCECQVPS